MMGAASERAGISNRQAVSDGQQVTHALPLARLPRCEREVKVKVASLPDPPNVLKKILLSYPDDRRYKAPVDSNRFHRFSSSQQFTKRLPSPPPSSTHTAAVGALGGEGAGSSGGGGPLSPPKQPKAVMYYTGPIPTEEERQRRRDENIIKYWKMTNETALTEARYIYRSHQFGSGKR